MINKIKRLFMGASNVLIELTNRDSIDKETRERNIEALKRIKVFADDIIGHLEEYDDKKDK